jgi:prepilin-type N-terminal cleavage/methylation domain-containing protein
MNRRGMTLVEILVSLVILSLLLGAVFSILNMQTVRSIQTQRTSVLQTDAQIALTLLKWDLATSGLGYPKINSAVQDGDATGWNGTDMISMRAVGLGFEAADIKWSWLLDKADADDTIMVRGWPAPYQHLNFNVGEEVIVLNKDRYMIVPPGSLTIQNIVYDDTFWDIHGNPVLAQRITLNNPLSAIAGLVVINRYEPIYNQGITYQVNNNKQLVRGSDILLDNVEELQLAYGIDNDGDDIIETWTNNLPAFGTLDRKWAIRYTMVVTSRPMGGYTYPHNNLNIENHTYNITTRTDKSMKRAILSGVISPANLQP